jgi:hypothetical protein
MWANSYKSDDKQPDFKIYINEYVAPAETQLTESKTDLPF